MEGCSVVNITNKTRISNIDGDRNVVALNNNAASKINDINNYNKTVLEKMIRERSNDSSNRKKKYGDNVISQHKASIQKNLAHNRLSKTIGFSDDRGCSDDYKILIKSLDKGC